MPRKSNDTVAVLGIDIGKHLPSHWPRQRGAIVSRGQLEAPLANMSGSLLTVAGVITPLVARL